MLTILDPLLVVIALVICITGFVKRSKMWMKGKPDSENILDAGKRLWDFIFYGIAHGRILREAYPGIMHLFIFFACLIPVLVILAVQLPISAPVLLSNLLSLFLDFVGLAGLTGIGLAAFRLNGGGQLGLTHDVEGVALRDATDCRDDRGGAGREPFAPQFCAVGDSEKFLVG